MLKVHQDALADEDAELLRDITSDSNLNLIFLDVFSGEYILKRELNPSGT